MKTYLTYENWDDENAKMLIDTFSDYMDVLKWAYREYGNHLIYACSFGAEGIVLLDLISKINKQAKVIFLDTHLHFKETYELIDKIKKRYPELLIKLVEPAISLQQQSDYYGDSLWEKDPSLCCQLRKIKPLEKELTGIYSWISGLRRQQSETRKNINYINKDEKFKRVKICPLIHWKWEDIWNYIKLNDLPYNELYDKNFPSIGCEKCTIPVLDSSDSRSGRWAHSEKTECGLHPS